MPIPLRQNMRVGSYFLRKKLKGDKRYPFIVEIEPLFACNLSCPGCGKIQHPTDILRKRMTPQEVFDAVEECGAPIVSIAGAAQLMLTRALRHEIDNPAVDVLELVVDGPVRTRDSERIAVPGWITADEVGRIVAELVRAGKTNDPSTHTSGPIVRMRPRAQAGDAPA